jgi:hypothetical protein
MRGYPDHRVEKGGGWREHYFFFNMFVSFVKVCRGWGSAKGGLLLCGSGSLPHVVDFVDLPFGCGL